MEFRQSLADDLDALTEALGDPVLDLEAVLDVLTDDLTAAVPSYLGLSMTLEVDQIPLTVTSFSAAAVAGAQASLWLSVVPEGATRPVGHVVFYASARDAFGDLADDARWMFAAHSQAVVDGHLPPVAPPEQAGLCGLTEFSDINQAIGILVAMGRTVSEAHVELDHRALSRDRTVLAAAQELLRTLTAKPVN